MGDFCIVGMELCIEGDDLSKANKFLRLFQAESKLNRNNYNLKTSVFQLMLLYKKAITSDELQKLKKNLIETLPREDTIFENQLEGSSCYGIRCKILPQGKKWRFLLKREKPLTEGFLLASEDWKKQVLVDDCIESSRLEDWDWKRQFMKDSVLDEENEWIELLLVGFYSYAALNDTMMLHASAIKYKDKAVLFTAPSGTGKTTQAELWRDYVGAEILNGDRVFVKRTVEDERFYAWGSPWSGSSPYIVNDSAEVTAIVVLEQAKENCLRKMGIGEAMVHLSSNSFLPTWDAKCLDGMLGVMDQVLRNVPVYKLSCRPDEEAVELVRKEVFG